MKIFFFVFLLCLTTALQAQRTLKGMVVDKERNLPIPGASIFLNNTSIGTTSNDIGKFELYIPQGKFELIVSSIGFETFHQVISSEQELDQLTIILKVRTEQLENILIQPFEKDGWNKWGKVFQDHFIGTRDESSDCRILNKDVLRFRHDRKNNELVVSALEPLHIENKALGYTLKYDLVHFSFNFQTRFLIYMGFPFFEEIKAKESQVRKWEKKRMDVYEGSLMHFMRSLYRNNLLEEGFEVRRLQKQENLEKTRVKKMLRAGRGSNHQVMDLGRDSSEYYNKIMQQEDEFSIYGKDVLPGDSIAYMVDKTTAGLEFENYLLIIFKKKTAPAAFAAQFPKAGRQMISEIILVNGSPIEIKSNGMYYMTTDLMSLRYWAWSEKIAAMLPFDYYPFKK